MQLPNGELFSGFLMAHFEAKYHTMIVEKIKNSFQISKTFKITAKVTNGPIMARKNCKITCFFLAFKNICRGFLINYIPSVINIWKALFKKFILAYLTNYWGGYYDFRVLRTVMRLERVL